MNSFGKSTICLQSGPSLGEHHVGALLLLPAQSGRQTVPSGHQRHPPHEGIRRGGHRPIPPGMWALYTGAHLQVNKQLWT